MTLLRLKTSSCILIEDDYNKNIVPLLLELLEREETINILCYEQPVIVWKNIFKGKLSQCFKDFQLKEWTNNSDGKCAYIIDSINQMILDIGWVNCLKYIKKILAKPTSKLIIIFHRDCTFNPKLEIHLNNIAHAIVSYDKLRLNKVDVRIKKGGKFIKTEETVSYNMLNSSLELTPVVNIKIDEPEVVFPNNLSTFKIETDQIQQLERNKLKLPYMSKINEGQGKVYYEPDAVDDWDDEDPDDDLDI